MRRLLAPIVLSLLTAVAAGCSFSGYDKPIRYDPDRHAATGVQAPAPHADTYVVVVKPDHGGPLEVMPFTAVDARRGDLLGFVREGDDLIATSLTEVDRRQNLGPVPPKTRFVAWAHPERRGGFSLSGFNRSFDTLAGSAFNSVGRGMLQVGAVATVAAVKATFDDDEPKNKRKKAEQDGGARQRFLDGRD